jgi:hypothetical protein
MRRRRWSGGKGGVAKAEAEAIEADAMAAFVWQCREVGLSKKQKEREMSAQMRRMRGAA